MAANSSLAGGWRKRLRQVAVDVDPARTAALILEDGIAAAVWEYEQQQPSRICIGAVVERFEDRFQVDALTIPRSRRWSKKKAPL